MSKHAISLIIFLILPFSTSGFSWQDSIDTKITRAWEEIERFDKLKSRGEVEVQADPRIKYAPEFFKYYLESPTTNTGKRALVAAITMWSDLNALEQIEEVIPQIDPHSDAWASFINNITNVYWNLNRRDDVINLLHEFENTLTHPKSKTVVFNAFGGFYLQNEETKEKGIDYFNKIIELQADPYYVQRAKGNLYELKSINVGQIAPNFTAEDITGRTISLSDLKGHVVLLDFWATWCSPCIAEIPCLQKIFSENRDNEFFLISISLDVKIEKLMKFLEKEKMPWFHICDEKAFEGEITKLYNVNGIPTKYVIDRKGKITFKSKRLSKEALVDALNQLFAQD